MTDFTVRLAPIYAKAPGDLKTRGQLKAMGLKPGGPLRGVVGRAAYLLYDVAEAVPFTTEEVAAEKERQRKARYKWCPHCRREVRKEKFDDYWNACSKCLDAVISRYNEELRAEHEKMLSGDRDDAIRWARSVLSDKATLIMDTETSNLGDLAEVVQVAIVNLDGVCVLRLW